MRVRCLILVVVLVVVLPMLAGCGEETPKTSITKEKYDQMWSEILTVMEKKRGMITNKDNTALLKKHGVAQEEWKKALDLYGMSDELRERQRKVFEPKVIPSSKPRK